MRNQESLERYGASTDRPGASALSIVGGMALAVVVVSVIASLPDIKRYVRMITM